MFDDYLYNGYADPMYSKLLALITDPPNLLPYTHLWAHISAYMLFSVFPTEVLPGTVHC